jgi:hypothetical protein
LREKLLATLKLSAKTLHYVPTISPGWDEDRIASATGRTNPTSPRDRAGGDFLAAGWSAALETEPDAVLIVSWNEFVENSHIEPSILHGESALATLRPLVQAWRGLPPEPPGDMPTAADYVLQINQDGATAYAAPRASAPVAVELQPGEYAIMGEENGFYAVDYAGVAVHLPFDAISIRLRDR